TAEEAQAWTKEQLAQTLRELRGNALESVQRLRAGTEKLREENRRTWEEGVANAPPELRDAAELMRTRLRDLAQVLKRAAREHGAGAPPPPADTSPPDEP
ncbi:MAG TPA: hypothetical protein VK928_08580, partial [Longimicrobiales bacterium]|nr:hypothetical protein [Longimicrobiales bacterium]